MEAPVAATDPDEDARRLAAASLAVDDPTGWFEQLYAEAEDGTAGVPWDHGVPHRLLVQWAESRGLLGHGALAVVVGCGLGDDAEYVASLGFTTVAFDVSATAVESAQRRYPSSTVDYVTADLLDLPAHWRDAFDLVVEIHTVQSMPPAYRTAATANVARLVGPGGTLLLVASGRDEDEETQGPPWPLSRAEIDAFAVGELRPVRVDDLREAAPSRVRRWRAELTRQG
jgi:SAM-dependent methyltransferase